MFSELVIVLEEDKVACLPFDPALFETLSIRNEVRPFKLVFLLEVPDWRCRWMEEAVGVDGSFEISDCNGTSRLSQLPTHRPHNTTFSPT